MGARRPFRSVAGITLAAAALAGTGCGSSFKLPTEQLRDRAIPSDGSYQMIGTWTGLTGVTDILLIPGPQLFLAFKGSPGRVVEYSTTEPAPIATGRFAGVQNPAALAATATSVFVLDQGDTAAARATGDSATTVYELDCGPIRDVQRIIVDLPKYWYVREYDLKGRTMKGSFTDTTFAWVNGVAADAQGRVYVSGVIRHCFVDPFDPLGVLRTLNHEFRIYRYERGTGDRYVIGGWRRDRSFEISEGTGIGSTLDPRGMSWSGVTGDALYFADTGNDEVQKFDFSGSLSFKLNVCDADTTVLVSPLDVGVDDAAYVYVVDAGNRRVLRYDPGGRECVQRVDIEANTLGLPLTGPVAVAAGAIDGRDYAYVVDAAVNQVVRYRRR
jgi:sugar lactone lactonase YvrE